MDKIDKWKSEIKGLNDRISHDRNDISQLNIAILSEYRSVQDLSVDAITTENAITKINELKDRIKKSESSIKSANNSIERRIEKIDLENKLRKRKY